VGRSKVELLDEGSEIGDILLYASLTRRPLAVTVPAPIIREDAERPGKCRDDAIPDVVVTPGSVDEHERNFPTGG
jgi:hypothetical protein